MDRRGQGFGWTVPCAKARAGELSAVSRNVEGLWGAFFPDSAGYSVERVERAEGLALRVVRGDFRGEIEVSRQPRERGALLKFHGHAGSQRLAAAEVRAARAIDRLRTGGSVTGALALFSWMTQMFVHPPRFNVDLMFLLGGLLVVVILVIALATGANLGAWLGEQVAAAGWGRALAEAEHDTQLREDLQRWRALVRNLAQLRDALAADGRRSPFRAAHEGHVPEDMLAAPAAAG